MSAAIQPVLPATSDEDNFGLPAWIYWDPDFFALEQETLMGFVFVRFEPGLPSVREMIAPYAGELAAFRMEELVPQGRVTLRPRRQVRCNRPRRLASRARWSISAQR